MVGTENDILELLAGSDPRQAQDFVLSFGENRVASWSDAHRQASTRAASARHLPHYRGQLRHQLGETALSMAAQTANVGCIPFRTVKPGGVFMVARLGRFGIVSLTVPARRSLPRKSPTRRLLSNPNDDLDPQHKLALIGTSRGATELAYFGCMVTCPSFREPTVPAEMVFAVPNARLNGWIVWMPLPTVYARLQDLFDKGAGPSTTYAKPIPDLRLPKFRLPKQDRGAGGSDTDT